MMIRDFSIHLIIIIHASVLPVSTEEIIHEIKHILTKSLPTAMDKLLMQGEMHRK